jgi:Haem-degrading
MVTCGGKTKNHQPEHQKNVEGHFAAPQPTQANTWALRCNERWLWLVGDDHHVRSAIRLRREGKTHNWSSRATRPGKPLYAIEHSNEGLITFPGGLPIVDEEGVLIGAIGVSGSAVENDNAVAEAGVKVVGVSDLPAHPWRT